MKNTAIIIPTRLGAKRFPNKPLAKINNTPMIIHVLNRAKEANIGAVFVATPDEEIFNLVNENGGKAILTKQDQLQNAQSIFHGLSWCPYIAKTLHAYKPIVLDFSRVLLLAHVPTFHCQL